MKKELVESRKQEFQPRKKAKGRAQCCSFRPRSPETLPGLGGPRGTAHMVRAGLRE